MRCEIVSGFSHFAQPQLRNNNWRGASRIISRTYNYRPLWDIYSSKWKRKELITWLYELILMWSIQLWLYVCLQCALNCFLASYFLLIRITAINMLVYGQRIKHANISRNCSSLINSFGTYCKLICRLFTTDWNDWLECTTLFRIKIPSSSFVPLSYSARGCVYFLLWF